MLNNLNTFLPVIRDLFIPTSYTHEVEENHLRSHKTWISEHGQSFVGIVLSQRVIHVCFVISKHSTNPNKNVHGDCDPLNIICCDPLQEHQSIPKIEWVRTNTTCVWSVCLSAQMAMLLGTDRTHIPLTNPSNKWVMLQIGMLQKYLVSIVQCQWHKTADHDPFNSL